MTIEQGLLSDDIEILALYCNIMLETYDILEVSKMLNRKFEIIIRDNNAFLCREELPRYVAHNNIVKLNYEHIRTNTIK